MSVVIRAMTYVVIFIGFVFVFIPSQLLGWAGIVRPSQVGAPQIAGGALVLVGGAIAAWCVAAFAVMGRGTPAPFDPPRRLVVGGPYAFVRNPMYWGAGLALLGAALYYRSLAVAGYALLFLAAAHLLVLTYEEPTLRRTFGNEYDAYCGAVRRWWPIRRARPDDGRGSDA